MAICWKLGWKSQPIIFMAAPFVRVLVLCKLKLTRTSLGAVVVMKSNEVRDLLFLRAATMRAHAFAPVSHRETAEVSPHLQVWVAIQVDSRVPSGTADSVHRARASSMNGWMLFLIVYSLLTNTI